MAIAYSTFLGIARKNRARRAYVRCQRTGHIALVVENYGICRASGPVYFAHGETRNISWKG